MVENIMAIIRKIKKMVMVYFNGKFYFIYLIRNDGRKYKGMWKNGKQHGDGEFMLDEKKGWRKGNWCEGKRVKWLDNNANE